MRPRTPPLFFGCGSDDEALPINRRLGEFLAAQNRIIATRLASELESIQDPQERERALRQRLGEKLISYIVEESPGKHDFAYWKNASERIGMFHWKYFQEDTPKLPPPP